MRNKGSVTVFISLLSSIFLLLFQIMSQSVQIQGGKVQAVIGVEEGLYSLFAEYDRQLLQNYHVFFVDGGYGTSALQMGKMYQTLVEHVDICCKTRKTITDRYGENLWNLKKEVGFIEAYTLASDQKGQAFKNQAIEYIKSSVGMQGIQLLLKGATREEKNLVIQSEQKTIEKVDTAQSAYVQAENENIEQTDEQNKIKNPLEIIQEIQKKGILTIVLPDSMKLSSAALEKNEKYSERECEQGMGLVYDQVGKDSYMDKVLFHEYMMQHLSCYGEKVSDEGLLYQLEYAICGKNTDIENLKGVANRILAIREAANMTFLMTNAEYQSKIHEMALSMAAVVGTPALEGVIALALEAAWAFGESLLDVKILFEGGELPLIKTQKNWKLPLNKIVELPELLQEKNTNTEEGIGYKEYLRMLLLAGDCERQVLRTMDMIECSMRRIEGKSCFRWDLCVSYLEATFSYSCNNINFSVTRNYGYDM